jgi:hypothetical protein
MRSLQAPFKSQLPHARACQNNCKLPIYEGWPIGYGIGSSIMAESNWFEYAFEHGAIYRPSSTYNWADADPANCTFTGLATADCYYEPLSTCPGLSGGVLPAEYAVTKSPEQLEQDRSFCTYATDSCTLDTSSFEISQTSPADQSCRSPSLRHSRCSQSCPPDKTVSKEGPVQEPVEAFSIRLPSSSAKSERIDRIGFIRT